MVSLVGYSKLIDCGLGVSFSGAKNGGRESFLVWRVGEGLGFEAEGGVLLVNVTVFSGDLLEKVPSVKLDAGFGGLDGEGATAVWIFDDGSGDEFVALFFF